MSTKEEGIRTLPGKPSCRVRKPKQDSDRGTEIPKRALLPERSPHLSPISHNRPNKLLTP